MRLALVVVPHPTMRGGAETHYDGLQTSLSAEGVTVERVELPCDESTFDGILEAYRAAESLDLSAYDAVISTKAPSYAVRHPRHALHLIHTIRVFYDMFPAWTDGSAESRAKRDRIRELDFRALSAIPDHRRFANGQETAERLERHIGLTAQCLHPALLDSNLFHEGPFEFLLHVGRLHPWKRADLVLRAFREVPGDASLVFAGTGPEERRLRDLAGGDNRIVFRGEVDRETLIDLYSRALSVVFAPIHEDFGYVTLEAMLSGKPVITCTDSGEPARIVEDGLTGFVTAPTPSALAEKMARLVADPEEARRMGSRGVGWARKVGWANVAKTLLASLDRETPARERHRVLIVDNQPIEPPVGGGRLRLHGIYSHLPKDLDPVYVGTYDWPGPEYRQVVHNGLLREITVPQSTAHFDAHAAIQAQAARVGIDLTFPLLASLSAGYAERVAYELESADAVVFSHPWVYPLAVSDPAFCGKPFVYDAQNVEGRLRRSILDSKGIEGGIADFVTELERDLCRRSSAVFACSEEDAHAFVVDYGIPRGKIHVIPNGVDARRLRPATPESRRAAREKLGLDPDCFVAAFVGSNYAPNVDAARFVFERLGPALPETEFVLAGGCTADLDLAARPNVHALGLVDSELRDAVYAAADIALNPMSRGSGTNIKMLDYFAAGLPVVTTDIGARGLPDGLDSAYVVCSLERTAGCIETLRHAPVVRHRMTIAGRLLAEDVYDWRLIGRRAGRVLRDLLYVHSSAHPPGSRAANREPRVAVVSTWHTACGIADYAAALVAGFPVPVRIWAARSINGGDDDPRVSLNWELGLPSVDGLRDALEEERPDAILVQHHPSLLAGPALRRLTELTSAAGVPMAALLHAAQEDPGPDGLVAYDRLARIYVHRENDARWLRERGVRATVRVIPHGVPVIPRRSVADSRRALGLDGCYLIGHFGFLRPHKGTLELIRAFDLVAGELRDARLVLLAAEYPSADSVEYRRECEAQIAASRHRGRIWASFDRRPIQQAALLVQACDVVAFPHGPSTESASGAARLAIAAGRPILVSDSDIFEELRGIAEVVAPATNVLAKALVRLGREPELREHHAAQSRHFASQTSWPRVAAQLWGDLREAVRKGDRR